MTSFFRPSPALWAYLVVLSMGFVLYSGVLPLVYGPAEVSRCFPGFAVTIWALFSTTLFFLANAGICFLLGEDFSLFE